jgi:hypothetical protein
MKEGGKEAPKDVIEMTQREKNIEEMRQTEWAVQLVTRGIQTPLHFFLSSLA